MAEVVTTLSQADDLMLRTVAVMALMGVALIHLVEIHDALNSTTPTLGWAFAALTAGAAGLALVLIRTDAPWIWLATGLLAVAAIAAYVFTRTVSTSFDNGDVGNWTEGLGLVALFVEVLLVVLSGYWGSTHELEAES